MCSKIYYRTVTCYRDSLVQACHFVGFASESLLCRRVHNVVNIILWGGGIKTIRRRNSLSCSVFSTAGSFGKGNSYKSAVAMDDRYNCSLEPEIMCVVGIDSGFWATSRLFTPNLTCLISSKVAIASASYRIENPYNTEKRKTNKPKLGKIGEKLEKNWEKWKVPIFAYSSPILWISGFFYFVAGQRGRNTGTTVSHKASRCWEVGVTAAVSPIGL